MRRALARPCAAFAVFLAVLLSTAAHAGDYLGTMVATDASDGGNPWTQQFSVTIESGTATVTTAERSWSSPGSESATELTFQLGHEMRRFVDADGDGVYEATWQAPHRGVLRNYVATVQMN